jgi:Sulfotransferase domain
MLTFRPDAGPVVVVGRPHSGSRVLAGLLRAAGVFLGVDLIWPQLDSASWYQRFVVPLVTSRYFPSWAGPDGDDTELDQLCLLRLADVWRHYWHPDAVVTPLWGWKYCESVFTVGVLRRYLPDLRVVHLVRDGRDVCLSHQGHFQISGSLADPPGWAAPALEQHTATAAGYPPTYDRFCRAVTFLDADLARWRGIDLGDPLDRVAHRYLLQMQAWLVSLSAARRAHALLGEHFIQVRYEDLCHRPHETAASLFDRLGLPCRASATDFLDHSIHAGRVGAWRTTQLSVAQRRDFDEACEWGAATLAEWGYPP